MDTSTTYEVLISGAILECEASLEAAYLAAYMDRLDSADDDGSSDVGTCGTESLPVVFGS